MTNTRVETTKTQSGASTESRNFSLQSLPPQVKLRQNNNLLTYILILTAHFLASRHVLHHFKTFQSSLQKPSPNTRQILTMPFCPDIPFFFVNVQLEDHGFILCSVNFITSASEMCTKHIEIKLFNNLKC